MFWSLMLKKIELKSEEIQRAILLLSEWWDEIGWWDEVALFSPEKGKPSVETDMKCMYLCRNIRVEELFMFS